MSRPRIVRRLARVLALAFVLFGLFAPRAAHAEPGDELTVYVITFGPGDMAFYKFGHDAIWIHNSLANPRDAMKRDAVYNWGTFAFGDPALIPKFVRGKFLYWLSKAPIGWTKRVYQQENRSVDAQELNLTGAQKLELLAIVEENAKDENKYYKYDYYRDNCATRVRDVVDRVIGGRLKDASQAPASMTYRQHTLRLTADDKALSMALTVVMGSVIDKPLNQWEEMFLPAYVQEGLRRVKVPGPNGTEIPLVKSESPLVVSEGRTPARTAPPSWGPYTFLVGLAFGAAIFLAARSARKSLGARIGLGALLFVAGFLSILGVLFVFVWIGTDHEVGWHNENMLQLVPWGVLLMGYCFGAARLKPKALRRARLVVTAAAAASLFGLVWKVLPWMRQDNYWIIAFAAPLWIGATLGLRALDPSVALTPAPATGPKEAPKADAPSASDEDSSASEDDSSAADEGDAPLPPKKAKG